MLCLKWGPGFLQGFTKETQNNGGKQKATLGHLQKIKVKQEKKNRMGDKVKWDGVH